MHLHIGHVLSAISRQHHCRLARNHPRHTNFRHPLVPKCIVQVPPINRSFSTIKAKVLTPQTNNKPPYRRRWRPCAHPIYSSRRCSIFGLRLLPGRNRGLKTPNHERPMRWPCRGLQADQLRLAYAQTCDPDFGWLPPSAGDISDLRHIHCLQFSDEPGHCSGNGYRRCC